MLTSVAVGITAAIKERASAISIVSILLGLSSELLYLD
jgi:hypothetical protein